MESGHRSQKLNRCHMLVLLSFCSLAASRHCDHQHYWDSRDRLCRPCTKCPLNEIIRRPCGRHSNTICGPFREFSYFNQLDGADSPYTSYDYETFFSENSSRRAESRDLSGRGGGQQRNEPVVQKDDGEYWKSLAFALIGVVCVLIFVATIVVLIACKKLHETAAVKRPEEDDDDDSGYVVIRAIRPPNMLHRGVASLQADQSSATRALLEGSDVSPCRAPSEPNLVSQRQELGLRGGYTPVRQLLNYDADDVFESEDSSGSRSTCRRDLPQRPLPESSGSVCVEDRANVAKELSV
ncbi:uncharacterized protein LOC143301178 [Babylonia areolata]|uniref:uncharacterized protein LOC143301178 n=1 Tax=Babylonia areolata TaxID=304850 RepID=UPI003FD19416